MGGIFAKDTERSGAISTKSFDAFVEIARQFAKAQLATASETKDFDAFSKGIHFDPLCEELPEYAPLLRKRFEEAKSRMSAMPFVLTHGDFNPNNLYPTGVIDLEDSFYGPYGYDIIGALSHIDSFPDSSEYEYFAKYRFTQKYLDSLDAVCTEAGRPKLTPLKEDFEFCRAVWLAVEIPHTPKLQRFRYDFVIKNFLD